MNQPTDVENYWRVRAETAEQKLDGILKTVNDNLKVEVEKILKPTPDAAEGVMDLYLKHPLFCLIMMDIADLFIGAGAKNYLETELVGKEERIGRFTLTIQRVEGKTPHQLRIESDLRRLAIERKLEKIQKTFTVLDAIIGTYFKPADSEPFWYPEVRKAAEMVRKAVTSEEH